MKKVGIIDNHISNFHSNTYFKLFHEIATEEKREEYKITHIYAAADKSPVNGETTEEWCEKTGAIACKSPKEVCDAVDVIMVLAPNNPELHEEFCAIAFKSGKRVYVDKTFAPDYATAKRIIEIGRDNGAQFWSSSATRFEPSLAEFLSDKAPKVDAVTIECGINFQIYSIHLIELMNTFMKNGAKSVICHNNEATLIFEVLFLDGRKAFLNLFTGTEIEFGCFPQIDGKCQAIFCRGDFWKGFSRALLDYFETGIAPISAESTLECIAVRSAMKKALDNPKQEILIEGAV